MNKNITKDLFRSIMPFAVMCLLVLNLYLFSTAFLPLSGGLILPAAFPSISGCLTPPVAFAASTDEIALLIKNLDSKDVIEQAAAVMELGKAGPRAYAAVRKMAKLLGRTEPFCLTLAYEGRYSEFSKIAPAGPGRRPFSLSLEVTAALDMIDPAWRGRSDAREAYDMFSADLDSDSPVKRKEALCAIARFERPDDAGLIFKLMYDEDGIVRSEAEAQLYRLKPGWREDGVFMSMNSTVMTGIPVSRLQKLYKKKIDYNDYFTTAGISSRDKRITDYFISEISNESAEIRMLAARALGQLRATDSVDLLITMLGDRDYAAAKSALLSLGRLDEKWNRRSAVPGAISDLKKRFMEIDYDRGMAVYLIQSIGTAEAAAALNELFDYCDETLKTQILMSLSDMPNGSAGKLVVKRFNGVSAINATYAMDGLKKEYPNWNKDTEAVSVIFEKLKPCVTGRDDVARIRAVDILSDIKMPFMRDFFVEAAGDTSEIVRSDAAYGLGRIGDTASVSILIEMLADTSEIVRGRASKALDAIDGEWRECTAAVEFAGFMKKKAASGPEAEKMSAVAALGKMNNNSWDIYLSAADFVDARRTATAISAMIAADETKASEFVSKKLSKDVSRDCKLSVIGAYKESFSPENASSVKLLAGLWLDDNEDVACTARFAIESRDRLKFSAASIDAASKIALSAIDVPDTQKKIHSIEMCGFFGVEPAFNRIAALLRDNDDKIRYAAMEALKGYPKNETERKVFEIINSETSEQSAAYDFLTGSMQEDIFKHLDELLAKSSNESSLLLKSLDNVDENWKNREEALAVFKKIIECVSDQSLEIRILACKKLARLSRPEAAEALKKALKEKDKRLRDAAGRALAAAIRESAVGPLLDIYDDERSLVPEKWSECLYTADKNWTSRDEVFKKIDSLLAVMTTEVSAEKRNDISLRLILILKNYTGAVLYEKYRERFSAVSKYFAIRLIFDGDEQKTAYHFIWQTSPVAYHEVAMLAESGNAALREAAARVFEAGPADAAAGLFPYEDGDRIRCLYLKKDPAGLEKYGERAVRYIYMLAEDELLYEKCYAVLDRLGGSPIQRKVLKYILSVMKASPKFVFEKLIVQNAVLIKIKKDLTAYFSGLNLKTINGCGGFEKLGAEYFNEKTAGTDKKAILETLARMDKIRTLDMLSGRLGSSDTAEILLAMDGLEFIGRLYNFRPLVNMLESKDKKIRSRAAALLSKLGFRPFRLKDKKLFEEALQAIEKKAETSEGGKNK